MNAALGWRIFLRSLFVQASWSFSRMQSLGFFLMTSLNLAPGRTPGPKDPGPSRHRLRGFNTHPYLAGLVAAVVVREEQLGSSEAQVENLKNSLMCALGAVGDEFFWGTLRPFAALAAIPAALIGVDWAPLIMLALYNIPHLGVRATGVVIGLSRGRGVVEMLQRRPLSRALPLLGIGIALLAGFIVGLVAVDPTWGLLPGRGLVSVAAAAAAFVLLLVLPERWFGLGRLLAGASALTVLAAVFRVVLAS